MTVSLNMVKSLYISPLCLKSFPCQHQCKIILADDREVNVALRKPYLDILVQAIAADKVTYENDKRHFYGPPLDTQTKTPDEVLTDIFKKFCYSC